MLMLFGIIPEVRALAFCELLVDETARRLVKSVKLRLEKIDDRSELHDKFGAAAGAICSMGKARGYVVWVDAEDAGEGWW